MSIQTSNIEAAKAAVEWHPLVQDTTIDERHHTGDRTLEIVFEADVDRVPPGVLRSLAEEDCGIAGVQPQGNCLIVEAI